MLRLLLFRLLPSRLFPLLIAWEIYRLLRSLTEERRVARARPVTGPPGSRPSDRPVVTTPTRLPRLEARVPGSRRP